MNKENKNGEYMDEPMKEPDVIEGTYDGFTADEDEKTEGIVDGEYMGEPMEEPETYEDENEKRRNVQKDVDTNCGNEDKYTDDPVHAEKFYG